MTVKRLISRWSGRQRSTSETEESSPSRRPLLQVDTLLRHQPGASYPSYGGTLSSRSTLSLGTPHEDALHGGMLNGVPEEDDESGSPDSPLLPDDEDEDWDMREAGLYRGSYWRIVLLYWLVPLCSLLTFVLLAAVPYIFYPLGSHPIPSPVPYLPFPLPELLLSLSLWSLTHTLRLPLYVIISTTVPSSFPLLTAALFAFLTSTLSTFLRLAALPILRLSAPHITPHDLTFRSMWWFALGWGAADVTLGICQGFETLSLYKSVMVGTPPQAREEEQIGLNPKQSIDNDQHTSAASPDGAQQHAVMPPSQYFPTTYQHVTQSTSRVQLHESPRDVHRTVAEVVEDDLDELIALKGREEVEEIYGMPFIRIPVFISCLLRVDTLVTTLGLTLLLSAAYIRSTTASPNLPPDSFAASNSTSSTSLHIAPSFYPTLSLPLPSLSSQSASSSALFITIPCVVVVQTLLTSLASPTFLARVGIHTLAYIGLLVGLGVWFAGMGVWEAVI